MLTLESSPLLTPPDKRDVAVESRSKFASSEGDHITLLKIFRAFKSSQSPGDWCKQHYVLLRHMNFAVQVRKQIMELCRRADIPVQSAGSQTEPVRRAFAQGLFTNAASLTREGHYVTLDSRQEVRIHPSSVMFRTKPELVVFTELTATQRAEIGVKNSSSYIRDLSLVDARWLLEAQPTYFKSTKLLAARD